MSPTAKCYELFHENMPIGFCAVIFNPKKTGDAYKRIHRIVIHPDWQGIGLGRLLATRIAHMENGSYDVFLQTSNPAMKKRFCIMMLGVLFVMVSLLPRGRLLSAKIYSKR